jgi:hypothetical protein
MDPAEIRFIRKAFIKERGAEVLRKICQSPILLESFKDSALPHTSVGNSETSSQRGNEIHPALGIGSTFVGFFNELSFPIPFEEPPVYLHLSHPAWLQA